MKKVLLAAIALMISTVTFAQYRPGTISIQPKIGLSIASLTDVDAGDTRIGLVTGAEFEFQLNSMVSLSAGALYSMQGEDDAKLDYINLPFTVNVYVTKGLAVKMGLQPEFNVNDDDISSTKSVALSIPIGMSYEYNHFVWDARYNFGVTKAFDHLDAKNSVFQLSFGYKFKL